MLDLMTDAPKSAKIIPQKGEGAIPANSNTLTPFSAMMRNTCQHQPGSTQPYPVPTWSRTDADAAEIRRKKVM